MPHDFSIRVAAREDVPAILAMIRELAEYEQLTHLLTASETQLAEELLGPASRAEALLGLERAEPVAYALFFHNFSTFVGRKGLYLEDLYVRPAKRHRGYGRALLLHVARIAQQRGCGRFEWMALDWNEPAIRFYQQLGATQLPEWRLFRVTGAALAALANQPE